jgi:hypothetical protein
MIAFGDRDHAARRRRPVTSPDGAVFMKSEWMETGDDPHLSPTVFLIEQSPNTVAQVHFHRQNQFQLFVAGSGTIGSHAISPLTVHYASAYTGYGPLISGADGLQYLTFRSVFDTGAYYIPEQRHELRKGPKRGGQTGPTPIVDEQTLRSLREIETSTLLAATPEGCAAHLINVPPGATIDIARAGIAHGCFATVVAGEAQYEGRELRLWETVFVSADERECALSARESGVSIVLLSMPVRDAAYA